MTQIETPVFMTAPDRSPQPADPDARAAARRRLRDWSIAALLLALFVAGLAGLAAATGWEEVLGHIMALTALQLAILLALSLVNYLGRGARWHIFTRALGIATTLPQDMRHFLGGFAMTVTPGRVGEIIRLRWIKRETGWAYERSAPVALADRASDLAAMGLLLAVSLGLTAVGIAGAVPIIALALGGAYVATHPRLLAYVVTLMHRALGRGARLFARIRSAARSLGRFATPAVLTPAILLGLVGWFAEGYALYLLLGWMGADIGLWTAVAIFTFATLAGGLTGAPGGLGGAEAAMIALLGLQGVPLEVSVPATAVIRLTTLWFAILIGLCVFPIAERRSMQGMIA